MPTVAEVIAVLDAFAPPRTAADWDNVGLIVGDSSGPADRLLTCLTVTPEVVAEAVSISIQMIITHHPIIFKPVKKISTDSAEGRRLLPLLRAGIAVYSPHTAFDNCPGGINDRLADGLGLVSVRPLRKRASGTTCKVAVFVPEGDVEKVSDAMFAAGAGCIGRYEQCSFRTPGTGTFFGLAGTNPTVGIPGRREQAPEFRLEVLVPTENLPAVLRAMRSAHSYEEPAFDVYPLKEPTIDRGGEGRIGEREPISLGDLALELKAKTASPGVQLVGDTTTTIRRVAVACGAAGEFVNDAIEARADVFITGELRFHDALRAKEAGLAVLVAGHYPTERPAVEWLADWIRQTIPGCTATASRAETDPFGTIL